MGTGVHDSPHAAVAVASSRNFDRSSDDDDDNADIEEAANHFANITEGFTGADIKVLNTRAMREIDRQVTLWQSQQSQQRSDCRYSDEAPFSLTTCATCALIIQETQGTRERMLQHLLAAYTVALENCGPSVTPDDIAEYLEWQRSTSR